jgi:hypothetical protein
VADDPQPLGTAGGSRSSTRATRPTRGWTTSSSSPVTRWPPPRTRAARCTGSETRSTPRSHSTSRPTTPIWATSRCAGSPRVATHRPRSTPPSAVFGKNDGDNETTDIHVSNGDPTANGILGTQKPKLFHKRVALVLHPAARRQRHLRGSSRGLGESADRRWDLARGADVSAGACRGRGPPALWC